MKQLKCEYCVNSVGYIDGVQFHLPDQEDEIPRSALLLEFMNMGTLGQYLKNKGNIEQETVEFVLNHRSSILLMAAKGIEYLHEQLNMVHLDVKADNILLHRESPDSPLIAKLSDFGSTRKDGSTDQVFMTPGYIAPEHKRSNKKTKAFDIYAFGNTLVHVTFKENYPFLWNGMQKSLKHKIKFLEENGVHQNLQFLISKTLEEIPSNRWVISQILELLETFDESVFVVAPRSMQTSKLLARKRFEQVMPASSVFTASKMSEMTKATAGGYIFEHLNLKSPISYSIFADKFMAMYNENMPWDRSMFFGLIKPRASQVTPTLINKTLFKDRVPLEGDLEVWEEDLLDFVEEIVTKCRESTKAESPSGSLTDLNEKSTVRSSNSAPLGQQLFANIGLEGSIDWPKFLHAFLKVYKNNRNIDEEKLRLIVSPRFNIVSSDHLGLVLHSFNQRFAKRPMSTNQLDLIVEDMIEKSLVTPESSMSKLSLSKSQAGPKSIFVPGQMKPLHCIVLGDNQTGKKALIGQLCQQAGDMNVASFKKGDQLSMMVKSTYNQSWNPNDNTDALWEFHSSKYKVLINDTPGHEDFLKNLIEGTSKAEFVILTISSDLNEYHQSVSARGQTRKHILLAYNMGISRMIVAVNKMDRVQWDERVYQTIRHEFSQLLQVIGFTSVIFVPVSAETGENVLDLAPVQWCNGWELRNGAKVPKVLTLVQAIDAMEKIVPDAVKPLRVAISDTQAGIGFQYNLYGIVHTGVVKNGMKVNLAPGNINSTIEGLYTFNGRDSLMTATPGSRIKIKLAPTMSYQFSPGMILSDAVNKPVFETSSFTALITICYDAKAFYPGYVYSFVFNDIATPCQVSKLLQKLDRHTGLTVQDNPKFVQAGDVSVINVIPTIPMCVETLYEFNTLGRFSIYNQQVLVAVGIVTSVVRML
ncbi:hypothetical protein BC833DRAFT_601722 [Globomyces pollinis-pini]|nr:hypothetical protein BC833DRAFT_601722 [Globomyces pollinis-pini]